MTIGELYATIGVASWLHDALSLISKWASSISVLDGLLLAGAAALIAWGWVRARAFAALGTIQIADLTCDADTKLEPVAARAILEHELGTRGLLPPSGVPGGSPSVANIADAISNAPIDQAKWLGSLLRLIPLPPTSTGFKISGTLYKTEGKPPTIHFAYELVGTGPRPSVTLAVANGSDPRAVIVTAAVDIYRRIGKAAPDIYPSWARWCTSGALITYRSGIELERNAAGATDEPPTGVTPVDATQAYTAAYRQYLAASQQDPDNMLARLRAANCLERMAAGIKDADDRIARRVQALAAYISIRIRQPEIFEAGFRASVLMSVLASEPVEHLAENDLLAVTLNRFERATARCVDPSDDRDDSPLRRAFARADKPGATLTERLEQAAHYEAREARRRLRPLWTMRHQSRFRHRFEPRGRERRQLRKALGITQMAQRARRAQRLAEIRPERRLYIRQLCWRIWVFSRYFVGRWGVAGWQAHYNAACFYALLPQATRVDPSFGSLRIRLRALKHLSKAINDADGALQGAYVRDEDPDLQALRKLSPQRFANVVGRICPDELTVHYGRSAPNEGWSLHTWGHATTPPAGRPGNERLAPVSTTKDELVFRIRIFDENSELRFLARCDTDSDHPGWSVVPASLLTAEIWVSPSNALVLDVEGHDVSDPAQRRQRQPTVTTA
jgi:hypothetical protein